MGAGTPRPVMAAGASEFLSETGTMNSTAPARVSRRRRLSKPRRRRASSAGGREEWMARLRERVLPPIRAFRPDLLIISAGFDAANHDVGNAGVDRRGQRLPGADLQPDDYEADDRQIVRGGGVVRGQGGERVGGWLRTPVWESSGGAAGLVREGLAACVVGHVRALAGLVPLA